MKKECIDDAQEIFIKYYININLYDIDNSQIVLTAEDKIRYVEY